MQISPVEQSLFRVLKHVNAGFKPRAKRYFKLGPQRWLSGSGGHMHCKLFSMRAEGDRTTKAPNDTLEMIVSTAGDIIQLTHSKPDTPLPHNSAQTPLRTIEITRFTDGSFSVTCQGFAPPLTEVNKELLLIDQFNEWASNNVFSQKLTSNALTNDTNELLELFWQNMTNLIQSSNPPIKKRQKPWPL
jgi:hypothetical protein